MFYGKLLIFSQENMERYPVIGFWGHSWSLRNILFTLIVLKYEQVPGHWCFWSHLKFNKYFVQIVLFLIWTGTRSLVFLVTLEVWKLFCSNCFVFYMNIGDFRPSWSLKKVLFKLGFFIMKRYQVIGVFGHSWSLTIILFKLFGSLYEQVSCHWCF